MILININVLVNDINFTSEINTTNFFLRIIRNLSRTFFIRRMEYCAVQIMKQFYSKKNIMRQFNYLLLVTYWLQNHAII